MVSPHIVHFTDRVCEQTRKHHARRIREHRTDGFRHRIAFGRDVQEPALGNQNKRDIRENADFHAATRLLFAKDFAHDVRREERRSEDDITKRRVEPEGMNENEHFDVCCNRANDGPGENALLAEEAEKGDESTKEHEDGRNENEFVLHETSG